jgi:hypothetical protein
MTTDGMPVVPTLLIALPSRSSSSAVSNSSLRLYLISFEFRAPDRCFLLRCPLGQGAGFTTPRTIIYVCYRTTSTGTLPSVRTSDV